MECALRRCLDEAVHSLNPLLSDIYCAVHSAVLCKHNAESRFLVNIPPEETKDTIRICFAVEQAHWHYTDFCLEDNPLLPVLNLKQLLVKMLNNYSPFKHLAKRADEITKAFQVYKSSIPVYGAIMMNAACNKVRRKAQGFTSLRVPCYLLASLQEPPAYTHAPILILWHLLTEQIIV